MTPIVERVVAIDWSGAKGERRRHKGIAVAEWMPDFNLSLRVGCSREEVADFLEELAVEKPNLIVGIDFAFSFPEWFARKHGKTIEEVWNSTEQLGEQWLEEIAYPFWNRKQWPAEPGEDRFRATDRFSSMGSPKSIFQLVGDGQVGPGSVRGMKYLSRLRKAGYSIWPFDAGRLPLIVEIYPTGCYEGGKRCPSEALVSQLVDFGFKISPDTISLLTSSLDARDAACALMRMVAARESFAGLAQATDPVLLLEGTIWTA